MVEPLREGEGGGVRAGPLKNPKEIMTTKLKGLSGRTTKKITIFAAPFIKLRIRMRPINRYIILHYTTTGPSLISNIFSLFSNVRNFIGISINLGFGLNIAYVLVITRYLNPATYGGGGFLYPPPLHWYFALYSNYLESTHSWKFLTLQNFLLRMHLLKKNTKK